MDMHTPGPWFISGTMTKYVEARIAGGLIQEVAACGPTEADGGYGDQQQANARLVAAAPDLLEALEKLTLHAEHGCTPLSSEIQKARNALAKAKGLA